VDIVAYLRVLRRHWKLIAVAALVGAVAGAASTLATRSDDPDAATFYKATHTLFLDTTSIGDQFRPLYVNLDQIAVLVTGGEVPRLVAGELGGDASDWSERIFTVTNGTTNTLDLTCAAPEADTAVTCADTFADQLQANLTARENARFDDQLADTTARIDSVSAQIAALDTQLASQPGNEIARAQRDSLVNQLRLAYERLGSLADQGGPASVISSFEDAVPETITRAEYDDRIARGRLGNNNVRADISQPETAFATGSDSSTRFSGPVSRGILGALLGLLVGIGLAVVADRVDSRIRTREEAEAAFGMPILAEVPALSASQQRDHVILAATAPLSRTAEAYRAVRSSLMFQRATDTRPRDPDDALVVLVASAGPREGKTTTSANLATMFAETGQRVLAINCDFRRPALHQFFDLPNEPRRVFETAITGLWVVTDVTSGPSGANPAFVVEEQRRLVASARKRFDVIVLDTAPMLTTNDATEVMTSADLAVVVCRSGVTTADGALRTRELLSRISAPAAGVVLLGSEATPNDYYYYYSRSRAQQIADSADPKATANDRAHLFEDPVEAGGDHGAPSPNGNGAGRRHEPGDAPSSAGDSDRPPTAEPHPPV
jgi:capsular exopolysaccharide synthesis family protein